jgi:demethylmenaquinone methyltransferase/2-methoxy-6-polyprenyl-1,4-benzoquinol methylase
LNKQEKIVEMFNDISRTYDVANRILSFGIDRKWREIACNRCYEIYDKNRLDIILDVACGTGDMCENWDKFAKQKEIKVEKIIGADPSTGMLEEAKKKGLNATLVEAEAKDLPFKDDSVDILSISYGLRNVVDRKEGLKEFYRVLKSGGLLVILEFTKLKKQTFLGMTRDFYIKRVLPLIGGLLSKNFLAYTYLPNSIDGFLTKEDLVEELEEIGFDVLEAKGYSMDISTMFVARK